MEPTHGACAAPQLPALPAFSPPRGSPAFPTACDARCEKCGLGPQPVRSLRTAFFSVHRVPQITRNCRHVNEFPDRSTALSLIVLVAMGQNTALGLRRCGWP